MIYDAKRVYHEAATNGHLDTYVCDAYFIADLDGERIKFIAHGVPKGNFDINFEKLCHDCSKIG